MMWRILESAGVVTGSLFVSYLVLRYRARRRLRSDFNYAMQAVAAGAVQRARSEHKIDLDYSPGSIERLENMLGDLHNRHLQNPMQEKDITVLSMRWGAYIGEVAKRIRPGKWQRDSEKAGSGSMPLIFEDGLEAFPCSWAHKRIADGPEDNIVFKFKVISDPRMRELVGTAKP
jgi:hypothetical protein